MIRAPENEANARAEALRYRSPTRFPRPSPHPPRLDTQLPRTAPRLTLAIAQQSEPEPAAFRARFVRKARRTRRTPHRGRRLAALAVALAVPAMAAPDDWRGFAQGAAVDIVGQPARAVTPMPFERPGASFPGSAFYYVEAGQDDFADAGPFSSPLDSDTGLPQDLLAPAVASDQPLVAVGPAARAFAARGGGVARARALQCLTMAIHYEAASESIAGQRAVAQVVLNRVSHPSYPSSVCGVVFQGSERTTGCQFSFTCDGSLARRPGTASWRRAQGVAFRALGGEVFAPVGLATHYHTTAIYPYWAPSLHHIGTIGAHRFYRWRGAAGTPAAFRSAHSGREPMAGPKPRSAADTDAAVSAVDPVALARAFEDRYGSTAGTASGATAAAGTGMAGTRRTPPASVPAPAPDYSAAVEASGGDAQFTARNLPSSTVKDEYASSGRWLREPGAPARTSR